MIETDRGGDGAPRRHILLVDDDDDLRETFEMYLSRLGHSIVCSCNGREALDVLQGPSPPDLVLLDLCMPIMDGRSFLAARRQDARLASIPVIVISGEEDRYDLREESDVVAVLGKPCDTRELEKLIACTGQVSPSS